MIVFPEDGIYGMVMTRIALEPYLEYIPDPKVERWCPCSDPGRHQNSEVQQFLSCMARNHSLYVVANFGDFQSCNKTSDTDCPMDEHYQYNTDLVYDKTGTLIAKYHKENLFYEFQFDKPKTIEYVYFDTPFGRFGVFTCFDIMFHEPAITLVTKYNVTNVAFPTAWMDALPLLAAVQFHSAFAAGAGINLLSANIHRPQSRFQGSGIYTPDGAVAYHYDSKSKDGQLLISQLSVIAKRDTKKRKDNDVDISLRDGVNSSVQELKADSLYFKAENHTDEFDSYVFHDLFTFVALSSSENLTVCQGSFCCHLEYEFAEMNRSDFFAFGAFDGLHTYQGKYYLQICALLKCASDAPKTCGNVTKQSSTKFKTIKIHANFSTEFIFPEILMTENEELVLAKPENWKYKNSSLTVLGTDAPILSAALFGRLYQKDG